MKTDCKTPKPIVLLGSTASGKTEIALEIAARLGGEIISADSRQVYRHIKAGTAKPEGCWSRQGYIVNGIPYHLVDFLDLDISFNAGEFSRAARSLINEIRLRKSFPILAGGTGLYIQALFNGLDPLPRSDSTIRSRWAQKAQAEGVESLHRELSVRDPAAAATIGRRNPQRLIRALEITEITGRPVSSLWTGKFHRGLPQDKAFFAGILWRKELLRKRIEERAGATFPEMISEAKELMSRGFDIDSHGLRCLGYPEAFKCAKGQMLFQTGLEKLVSATRAYSKRQATWFRRYREVMWMPIENLREWDASALAETIIRKWKRSS